MSSEHEEICPFCDPEKFVVYGKCKMCGLAHNPPLRGFEGIPLGFCTERGSDALKKLIESQRDFDKNEP